MHLSAAQEFRELNSRYSGEIAKASRASGLALMLYDLSQPAASMHFLYDRGIPRSLVASYSSQWFACDPLLPEPGCGGDIARRSVIRVPDEPASTELNQVYYRNLGGAGYVEAAALSRPVGRSFYLVVGMLSHQQRRSGSICAERAAPQLDRWLSESRDFVVEVSLRKALDGGAEEGVLPVVPVSLTPREKQLVEALLQGRSNKQIASDLQLSEYTIENYLSRLYRKFSVHSRTALLASLRQSSLV